MGDTLDLLPGMYRAGGSLLHRTDARTKVLVAAAWVILAASVPPRGLLPLGAALLLAAAAAGEPGALLGQSLRVVGAFLGFLVVYHAFADPGRTLVRVGPVRASTEGVEAGLVLAARIAALVLAGALLTRVTPPSRLLEAVLWLLSPGRYAGLPVDDLALMLSVSLRLLPTLAEEAQRIRRAQVARGLELGRGGRLQGALALMVPLLVRAFARADELAAAMEARGFRPGRRRRLRLGPLHWADGLVLAGGILTCVLAVGVGGGW